MITSKVAKFNIENTRQTMKILFWWFEKTISALLFPYYVLGGIIAISLVTGVSYLDTREFVVSLAGMEINSWEKLATSWKIASLTLSSLCLVFYVFNSNPVKSYLFQLFEPVQEKIFNYVNSNKGWTVAILFFIVTLIFLNLNRNMGNTKATQIIKDVENNQPISSASIYLPTGEIISGNAIVLKENDGYIVKFKK